MIRIKFKLFAMLTDFLPDQVDGRARTGNVIELDIAEGTTVQQMIDRYRLPDKWVHLVLVNGVFIPPGDRASRALVADDALAIWPPIAGG
ncbi:MAG: sulfur carrier protein ThiS [Quisquiliibacterium sp.]